MPWWRRDEHEAVDVEAAHFRHPHSADPWPAGPFSLAPQFEHQRSHLWGAAILILLALAGMIPVGLAILCLFVLYVLNFCSMSLQEQADVQGRTAPSTGYDHLHQPGDATLPLELMQLNMESRQQRAFLQNVLQSHVHHPIGVHPLARVLAGLPADAVTADFHGRSPPEPVPDEQLAQLPCFPHKAAKAKAAGSCADEEDNSCSICLDPFEEGLQIMRLPCLHVFHRDCIAPWLQRQGVVQACCPLCKTRCFNHEGQQSTGQTMQE